MTTRECMREDRTTQIYLDDAQPERIRVRFSNRNGFVFGTIMADVLGKDRTKPVRLSPTWIDAVPDHGAEFSVCVETDTRPENPEAGILIVQRRTFHVTHTHYRGGSNASCLFCGSNTVPVMIRLTMTVFWLAQSACERCGTPHTITIW